MYSLNNAVIAIRLAELMIESWRNRKRLISLIHQNVRKYETLFKFTKSSAIPNGTRNSDLVCIHSACGRVSPSIDCNVTHLRNRSIATRAMDGAPRGGLTRLTMECTTKQRFPMAKEIFSRSYIY